MHRRREKATIFLKYYLINKGIEKGIKYTFGNGILRCHFHY